MWIKKAVNRVKERWIVKTAVRCIAYCPCANRMQLNKFHPRNRERKSLQNLCTKSFSQLAEFEVVPPNVIDLLEQFFYHLHNFSQDKDTIEVRYKRFITQTKHKINPETHPSTKDEFFSHIKRSNCIILMMKSGCKLYLATLLPQDHGWLLIEDVNALMLVFCVLMYV